MKLTEAIEILKGTPSPQFILEGKAAWKACQLGIEAVKVILEFRTGRYKSINSPLPGETPE